MNRRDLLGEAIYVIDDFLSQEECADQIRRTEAVGYEEATITTVSGFVIDKERRNNSRLMIDDLAYARFLWERLLPFAPSPVPRWEPVGLNERFRYYRYDPGERFKRHSDGHYRRDNGEVSRFTFMVYLNDGFEGGETIFHFPGDPIVVRPATGQALLFQHSLLHEGAAVIAGRKYVLRSDVMFRRREGHHRAMEQQEG